MITWGLMAQPPAEFFRPCVHVTHIRSHALDIRFEIAIAGLVLGEPEIAVLGHETLAVRRAACGIDRRRAPPSLGDNFAGIRNDDLAFGSGQRRSDVSAVELALEFEIGIGPESFEHLDEFAHPRIALGIADPSAVAEQVKFLLPPAVDDVDRKAAPR
jgi:hypothetical protein